MWVNVLTDVEGADGERSSHQLIHQHLSSHRPDSAPRQHPLQPPEPVVVEVGMETEAHGGHPRCLMQVDGGDGGGGVSLRLAPPQQPLLDEVGGGEERGVAQDVADVGVSCEQSPGSSHGRSAAATTSRHKHGDKFS